MKINKITFFICFPITVLNFISLIIFKDNSLLQGIFSGIFTGFIASDVVALIGYFYERSKICASTDRNIKELYLNMTIMSKTLGKILPEIHDNKQISESPFRNLLSLSKLNYGLFCNMNVDLFAPFYNRSRRAISYERLKDISLSLSNIKYCSIILDKNVLEYENKFLIIQNNQMIGIQAQPEQLEELDKMKNLINVSTSKLHEYITGQALELSKIAQGFYKCKSVKMPWNDIEAQLVAQAENIMRGV